MERRIVTTEDGSPTLHVPGLGEHYHSIHGARNESEHIFINAAFKACSKKSVRVLEFGFGSGLNALLTLRAAREMERDVYYHGIEKYPLEKIESETLIKGFDNVNQETDFLRKLHSVPWEEDIQITENFTLRKEKADFRECIPSGMFDVIYFDAFAPEVQPNLWEQSMFEKIVSLSSEGAILTTYSCKGLVKRNLKAVGFDIEKLPGPPGKREFLRAINNFS